ncbi:MAG: hypothetical protein PHR22_04465 [Candidatus Omnitrophica bacterium]|nr:hypothetical protein [Candidatus Omnitrophota bacterium]
MMRMMGVLVLIPASALLTASFFVLFALERVKEAGLKNFGKVVAVVLLVVSVLLYAKGIYTIATGSCPMMESKSPMCGMGMGMGKHEMMEKGMMGKGMSK